MQKTQSFRVLGTRDIKNISLRNFNDQKVVYWSDIENTFPGVGRIYNGGSVVTIFQGSDEARFVPRFIVHCPGIVLDVVVFTAVEDARPTPLQPLQRLAPAPTGDQVVDPPLASVDCASANNDHIVDSSPRTVVTLSEAISNPAIALTSSAGSPSVKARETTTISLGPVHSHDPSVSTTATVVPELATNDILHCSEIDRLGSFEDEYEDEHVDEYAHEYVDQHEEEYEDEDGGRDGDANEGKGENKDEGKIVGHDKGKSRDTVEDKDEDEDEGKVVGSDEGKNGDNVEDKDVCKDEHKDEDDGDKDEEVDKDVIGTGVHNTGANDSTCADNSEATVPDVDDISPINNDKPTTLSPNEDAARVPDVCDEGASNEESDIVGENNKTNRSTSSPHETTGQGKQSAEEELVDDVQKRLEELSILVPVEESKKPGSQTLEAEEHQKTEVKELLSEITTPSSSSQSQRVTDYSEPVTKRPTAVAPPSVRRKERILRISEPLDGAVAEYVALQIARLAVMIHNKFKGTNRDNIRWVADYDFCAWILTEEHLSYLATDPFSRQTRRQIDVQKQVCRKAINDFLKAFAIGLAGYWYQRYTLHTVGPHPSVITLQGHVYCLLMEKGSSAYQSTVLIKKGCSTREANLRIQEHAKRCHLPPDSHHVYPRSQRWQYRLQNSNHEYRPPQVPNTNDYNVIGFPFLLELLLHTVSANEWAQGVQCQGHCPRPHREIFRYTTRGPKSETLTDLYHKVVEEQVEPRIERCQWVVERLQPIWVLLNEIKKNSVGRYLCSETGVDLRAYFAPRDSEYGANNTWY
ncbi:hypothetical protein BGZ94_001440 [Podila epigama]|nr:hypothetical protein BGZ94_001440 [Podila epigama]